MKNTEAATNHFYRERAFTDLAEGLEGRDQEIAKNALWEIQVLKREVQLLRRDKDTLLHDKKELQASLKSEQYRSKEMIRYFSRWTEEFAKIIKIPIDMENETHIRQHYFSLRESAKNLVHGCRRKLKEIDFARDEQDKPAVKRH
ncbi:hypothetical protein BB776_03960 [Planococcus salinarum]|uniref:Uncharacterized protein n=1 Tax=Planococcus salinarum TaxID=622695 RepID=A0ABX3CYH2_9BACL|nr:hypothetical protein [Planococcus salinarum]OHX50565.1 hypothetical protein BB776_03960 [Planococcus salinarum]TAA73329.1 hypothetical protein D2909_00320 [Planococcus salinarum]